MCPVGFEDILTALDAINNGNDTVNGIDGKKQNIEELREKVYEAVKNIFQIRYPYNNYLFDVE